ncbi:MAG: VOC family protein [Proteobacteria bacterium]|nr:VOC family protein [Pseudomonadota bacterium]
MTLPMPTLDHVVINTRERLDAAAACYRRLGFQLTPRGHHTLGSMNHLAIFGTEYLELIGIGPNATRADLLRFPVGLDGLVFGTDDSRAVYDALKAAGVPVGQPNEFSRPVALAHGTEDASFRTVRLEPQAVDYGRLYFCHHLTRHLVWRDEWRRHPNGTIGVVRAVICAADPAGAATLYRTMFGPDAVRPTSDGASVLIGLSRFDIVTPRALAAAFGPAAPDPQGRTAYMAALTLRTTDLARATGVLSAAGVRAADGNGRVIVPAAEAFGATLEFVA